jgi:hypothetical protein
VCYRVVRFVRCWCRFVFHTSRWGRLLVRIHHHHHLELFVDVHCNMDWKTGRRRGAVPSWALKILNNYGRTIDVPPSHGTCFLRTPQIGIHSGTRRLAETKRATTIGSSKRWQRSGEVTQKRFTRTTSEIHVVVRRATSATNGYNSVVGHSLHQRDGNHQYKSSHSVPLWLATASLVAVEIIRGVWKSGGSRRQMRDPRDL